MVFSSLLFAFYFLPLTVIIYYLSKEEYRNYILLIASLIFYSYGEPKFVFVMLSSIAINYIVAIGIAKTKKMNKTTLDKCLLILAVLLNIGILFIYKYLDFSIKISNKVFNTNIPLTNIVLPIGISFFTFQALSYVIDVYKGKVEVQNNPFYLALYISFFPQLIAGPIVRYSTINEQITNRKCTIDGFADGFKRFLIGFCKKVILANNLYVVVSEVFEMDFIHTNPLTLWMGSICFSLQIYYDFSGYSDMAIGLGRMFGFEFEENFNYPYISKSITEFWRRWHISLGQWFRDYVYIPLGGS
ncbi:MAG: MBOAT family O-acyltransferase, partial [Lachnospiraceae bacterium]|nr:MBOAT family O-acyltransferase [Lachnospiraceae bacterium]